LQRFISEDPIEFAGGDVNFYAYVSGDPINYSDPTGEVAPVALVLPYVIPALGALGKAGVYVGTAALGGYLTSRAISTTLTREQEAEKAAEYDAYKNRCQEPPPPGLGQCEEL
jgi:uncharacterized protein RhaS with RHS repeats